MIERLHVPINGALSLQCSAGRHKACRSDQPCECPCHQKTKTKQ